MIFRHRKGCRAVVLMTSLCLLNATADAATLNFTLTTSEPVTITGTPRLAIDVGGVTRYATYTAGSGTSSLTFSYAVQARDFDANGIALVSPLDLNGGSIVDGGGTPATNLGFTLPDTSGIRIQTYTTAFTTAPITSANANAVGFTIAKAPQGSTFNYTITSSGGAGSVTGSGTISSSPQAVTGVDVTSLPPGTLTLSVTITTSQGGTGAARQNTAVLDAVAPTGYSAAFLASYVSLANQSAAGFQIAGGEIGASYSFSISSSGGGTPVTGTGTVSADPQQITGLNLAGLGDGTLTVSVTLSVTVSTATGGTGAARSASTTPGFAGPLDGLTGLEATFAVRRMLSAFSGPLLRVRRSSDNAETDISGNTVGGKLDQASLTSFCGTGTCYVKTWYDQSGYGRNAVQSATANQGPIMSAGTLQKVGQQPGVLGDGVNTGYTISGTVNASTLMAVTRPVVTAGGGSGYRQVTVSSSGMLLARQSNGRWGTWASNIDRPANSVLSGGTDYILSLNNGGFFVNGAADGTYAATQGQPAIGLFVGSVAAQRANVIISEVVWLSSPLATSSRQTLERNMGSFYQIAVQ